MHPPTHTHIHRHTHLSPGRPRSGQRWRSRSGRCSRPSVPLVTRTQLEARVFVAAGSPWRGWPPQVTGARFQRKNSNTHTNERFPGCENNSAHIRQLTVFTEKMFRWKSLHRTAPAGAQRQTPARLQCRIFETLQFPKHFQSAHTASKRSGSWGKVTVSHNRVISEPNPPKPCVTWTERLVWNPFEIINSPEAKNARFPWLWRPLFLLSLQIFLHCVARLESKNVLGWIYLYQRDLIAYSCMAWQQNMELNIPLEDY